MEKFARQSILTTLSHYLGVAIGYFNVLWLFPYSLAPEQIGIFRTVQDMAMLLVPFAQLGLGNAITRFFPKLKSRQGSFLTFSILVTLMGFIAVSLLFFIFKNLTGLRKVSIGKKHKRKDFQSPIHNAKGIEIRLGLFKGI